MKIAFDIGANKGEYVDFFLSKAFDKVVAVEANPLMIEFLKDKYATDSRVEVVGKAISDVAGQTIDFWVCSDTGISSADLSWSTIGRFSRDPNYKWEKIQVRTTTIDQLVLLYGAPNHIKMDVEGYESVALRGMSLAYCPVRFEWEEEKIDELEQSLYHMKEIGYYYFGIVTELGGAADFNYDQRPPSYFSDISDFMREIKAAMQAQHNWNATVQYTPEIDKQFNYGYAGFKDADSRRQLFWGMCWCFRKMDGVKLNLKESQ
jgi:FkbM family methyltransferase